MTASNQDENQVNAIENFRDDVEDRSITHFDYIHDDEDNEDQPRFVIKLQNTIEVGFNCQMYQEITKLYLLSFFCAVMIMSQISAIFRCIFQSLYFIHQKNRQ